MTGGKSPLSLKRRSGNGTPKGQAVNDFRRIAGDLLDELGIRLVLDDDSQIVERLFQLHR